MALVGRHRADGSVGKPALGQLRPLPPRYAGRRQTLEASTGTADLGVNGAVSSFVVGGDGLEPPTFSV